MNRYENFKQDYHYFALNEFDELFNIAWETKISHVVQFCGLDKPQVLILQDKDILKGQQLSGIVLPFYIPRYVEKKMSLQLSQRMFKLRFGKALTYVLNYQ